MSATAVAVLQQVERGSLDLDGPIARVLPEMADLPVLDGFDDGGRALLRPAATELTLRHLLTHTGGCAYDFWNADVARYQQLHDVPGIIACQEVTLRNPLLRDPGSGWEYGPHIDIAGRVVERVTGRTLEDYFRDNVFGPLGMDSSGFAIGDRRPRLVGMNARAADGTTDPMEFEIPQEPEFHMGGGGLYSTPDDYLRLLQALLRGGELDGARVLDSATLEMAKGNHIGDLTVGVITTADPGASYDVDLLPGTTKKWSLLGMLNVEETPDDRSAGSLFWAGLSNCYFWVDWERGHAGALFSQLLPFADPAVLEVFDRFENSVRGLQKG
ncbi:serine hydrolase domain-containing protein [Pseudonocardia alni]|uniref:serine hydrolase domain-containing protein n=1 Tax=Pseudonocardia alni TaxID=33907 RepID=UPI0033229A99